MKRLLIVTNIATVCILLIIVVGGKSCKLVQRIVCNHQCEDSAGTTLRSGECNTCYPGACTEQFDGVNAVLAKSMLSNYRDNQLQSINFPDSRAVWFSLPTLKRFIHEIESKICDSCNQATPQLGVRIYYGAYPSSTDWAANQVALGSLPSTYASQHTIVMVPTIFDGESNYNVDFDPNYINANCAPLPMCDVYSIVSKINDPNAATITVLTSGNNSMQNHGEMEPPPPGASALLHIADATCNEVE